MAIKFWSWSLSILYALILYKLGFEANQEFLIFYRELYPTLPKLTYYFFNIHWMVLLVAGIIGTLVLIGKDWVCSKHVAIKINWIATIIILAMPFVYSMITLNIPGMLT